MERNPEASISERGGGPWGEPSGDRRRKPTDVTAGAVGQKDWEALLSKAKRRLGRDGDGGPEQESGSPLRIGPMIFALVAFWFAKDMFYIVDEGHRAIILRFGKALVDDAGAPVLREPGPHLRLPGPIDRVVMVQTDAVRKEEIGFESYAADASGGNVKEDGRPDESLMLTGDENIIDVKLVVQWKVKNPADYGFNVRDLYGENTVKTAASGALREALGGTKYTEALQGEGREKIESEVMRLLQTTLDSYRSGIKITSVDLKHIDPPEEVLDAFRDVQTARANKETIINQAHAYANDVVPRAKGAAGRILQEAEAYRSEKVDQARGEAGRFLSIYKEYAKAKDVTRERLYAETMEDVLSKSEKIVLDTPSAAGVLPYLPLDSKAAVERVESKSVKP